MPQQKASWVDRILERTSSRKSVLVKAYLATGNLIIDALVIAVLIALIFGTVSIFIRLPETLRHGFSTASHDILNSVMLVFVFVELFRVLIDYFKEERVKITYIADATLVFIFKEIWIKFSEPGFDSTKMLAMAATIIAVAVVRVVAVMYSPMKQID